MIRESSQHLSFSLVVIGREEGQEEREGGRKRMPAPSLIPPLSGGGGVGEKHVGEEKEEKDKKYYSWGDISVHNSLDDCWVVFQGKVFIPSFFFSFSFLSLIFLFNYFVGDLKL